MKVSHARGHVFCSSTCHRLCSPSSTSCRTSFQGKGSSAQIADMEEGPGRFPGLMGGNQLGSAGGRGGSRQQGACASRRSQGPLPGKGDGGIALGPWKVQTGSHQRQRPQGPRQANKRDSFSYLWSVEKSARAGVTACPQVALAYTRMARLALAEPPRSCLDPCWNVSSRGVGACLCSNARTARTLPGGCLAQHSGFSEALGGRGGRKRQPLGPLQLTQARAWQGGDGWWGAGRKAGQSGGFTDVLWLGKNGKLLKSAAIITTSLSSGPRLVLPSFGRGAWQGGHQCPFPLPHPWDGPQRADDTNSSPIPLPGAALVLGRGGGGGVCTVKQGARLTSESSFETISSGAWLMESSCRGDVRAMSTRVRISFKTTSQRLGLLSTFLYL